MSKRPRTFITVITQIRKCGVLRDLVPFVQVKKREKYPCRSVNFSKVGGGWEVTACVLSPPAVLIQHGFLGVFSGIAVFKASLTLAHSTYRVKEVSIPLTNFPTEEHFEMIHLLNKV